MVVDLPQLVFTYIARKAAKQEWNSKKKKKKVLRSNGLCKVCGANILDRIRFKTWNAYQVRNKLASEHILSNCNEDGAAQLLREHHDGYAY
jgi:hypothetical protein